MRVAFASDIHLEFHGSDTRSVVEALDPTGVDVLVLAGDIANARTIGKGLTDICAHFTDSTVIFVAGNHEPYGASPDLLNIIVRSIEAKTPNLRFLDDQLTEVGGVVFAGTSLWFRDDRTNEQYEGHMADFSHISGFKPWVYDANRRAEAFLREALAVESGPRAVDVVVTHHLPSAACVSPQYKGSPINRFFCTPIADELDRLPQAWIYGHTHDGADFTAKGCRFLCNPRGYPSERKPFRNDLTFDIEHRPVQPDACPT